jgi:hypothetical protein
MATPRFDILAKTARRRDQGASAGHAADAARRSIQGRAGPVDTYLFDLRHQSPGGSIFSVDSMEKNPSEN